MYLRWYRLIISMPISVKNKNINCSLTFTTLSHHHRLKHNNDPVPDIRRRGLYSQINRWEHRWTRAYIRRNAYNRTMR